MTFKAILHRASTDSDGEWTVVLKVPASNGPDVAALALETGVVFDVMVKPEGDGNA